MSSGLSLYLIRHAQADERGPNYPDDSLRPLIKKGGKQASALQAFFKQQGIPFDHLCYSPYSRAQQTAEPLIALSKSHFELGSLTHDHYDALLSDLRSLIQPASASIACVGHEPYLSEFASLLLTGEKHLTIHFRKAAILELWGQLRPAGMQLESFVTARVYRQLHETPQ